MNRRSFLAATVAAAVAAACGDDDASSSSTSSSSSVAPSTTGGATTTAAESTTTGAASSSISADPFGLGVASGDPLSDSVILWTRLIADHQAESGGLAGVGDVEVDYVVATDEALTDVVDEGTTPALEALAHSVHLDAAGLEPDSTYYYQFSVGDFTSPVGRTRTLAATGTTPDLFRFAYSSCQNWEAGEFAAYRHMAEVDDIDLFLFLGDYIYEYESGEYADANATRTVQDFEAETLEQYRQRYGLYKSDGHLQSAHALVPWLITWDDHEVSNDYGGAQSENDDEESAFLERRAAAYQAWYEHMPVRVDPPDGPDLEIYHSVSHGDLLTFHVLDGRQYRSPGQDGEPFVEALGSALQVRDDELAFSPDHTMLGAEQEQWLTDTTAESQAIWDVLAQQVFMFGGNALPDASPPVVLVDTWDGFAGARERLLESVVPNVDNLVVLSGDFHSAAVGDLRTDPFDTSLPVVGTEFMAGPISSAFFDDQTDVTTLVETALATNEQIRYFDAKRGYTRCEVTPDGWTSEFLVVNDPFDADSAVEAVSRWEVSPGTPGAVEVG